MTRTCILMIGGLLALAGGPASAQSTNPGGMEPGPAPRPLGMGEQDGLVVPSAADQISIATQRAATERAAATARRGPRARPAAPAEILAGSPLTDMAGELIGTIESVTPDGAVVTTAGGAVMVPLDAFGIAGRRLLLSVSKGEFETMVAGANAEP